MLIEALAATAFCMLVAAMSGGTREDKLMDAYKAVGRGKGTFKQREMVRDDVTKNHTEKRP